MPRLQKNTRTNNNQPPLTGAILVTAASLLVLASLFSERMGLVGGFLRRVLWSLFGLAAYLLPVISLGAALAVMLGRWIKAEAIGGLVLVFLMIVIGVQLSTPATSSSERPRWTCRPGPGLRFGPSFWSSVADSASCPNCYRFDTN